jgi:hypothetical protein
VYVSCVRGLISLSIMHVLTFKCHRQDSRGPAERTGGAPAMCWCDGLLRSARHGQAGPASRDSGHWRPGSPCHPV